MDENIGTGTKKPENTDSLHQMSEDMKLHIAQLKAELGNSDSKSFVSPSTLKPGVENQEAVVAARHDFDMTPMVKKTSKPPISETHDKSICGILLKTQTVSFRPNSPGSPTQNITSANQTTNSHFQPDVDKVTNMASISTDEKLVDKTLNLSDNENELKNMTSHHTADEMSNEHYPAPVQNEMENNGKFGQHKNSSSSVTSANSTCSVSEPVDMKYLQMSSASPKLIKKVRMTGKSSSTPSSARGCRSDPSFFQSETTRKSRDELHKFKYEKLEERLMELQTQCEILAEENIKLKKDERAKAIEKITTLKKSNGELANIAKRLEEKARGLQEQNLKKSRELSNISRELQQQKRHYQRHKGRWEAELTRVTSQSNEQLDTAKNQLEDLKRALRQLRREKYSAKQTDDDSEATKQKELLRLQKLAAAASSKVIVRSLSTPTTARQKILEESNRGLRKQVSTLENRLQASEAKLAAFHEEEEKLEAAAKEKKSLQNDVSGLKSSVALLETELQRAKVEASDTSVQLNELKHVHEQIQDEYSTVHEQLAVAIRERDQAVKRCLDESSKLARVQEAYAELQSREEFLRNQVEDENQKRLEVVKGMGETHEEELAEHRQNIALLQKKISRMEQEHGEIEKELKHFKSIHRMKPLVVDRSVMTSPIANNPTTVNLEKVLPINEPDLTIEQVEKHSPALSSGSLSNSSFVQSEVEEDALKDAKVCETRLCIAKYSYNPFEGPNENPECELPLVAGDFLYIEGEPDEDGFYEGKKLDGRCGLIPSNFIELVPSTGDGVVSGKPTRSTDPDAMNSSHTRSATTDVLTLSNLGTNTNTEVLPHPTELRATVHHRRDIMLEWSSPVLEHDDAVTRYDVIVNGCMTRVTNSEKVILKEVYDVDRENHVINVCCVTNRGRSDPGHCMTTMSSRISKIEGLSCEHVTPDFVRVFWRPLDSSFAYKISIGEVNGETERLTRYQRQILVPQPMYKHTIEGLRSGQEYELLVETKHLKPKAISDTLRFRTPTEEPPLPPTGIQVDVVESDIVISWLSTNDERMPDVIVGYQVYLNELLIGSSVTKQCEVKTLHFATNVVSIIKQDSTFQFSDGSFVDLPPLWVVLRTVGANGQFSEFSSPFRLLPDFIESLCREANYSIPIHKKRRESDVSIHAADQSNLINESLLGAQSTSLDFDSSSSFKAFHDQFFTPRVRRKKLRSSLVKPRSKSWCPTDSPFRHGKLSSGKSLRSFNTSSDSSFSADFLQGSHKLKRSSSTPSEDERPDATALDPEKTSASSKPSGESSANEEHDQNEKLNDAPLSLYVALFDYTPSIMSPNSDCFEDELGFTEGQLLKVYGGPDEDGFLVGENRLGKRGFVPSNMVANVEVEDYTMLEILFERGALSTTSPQSPSSSVDFSPPKISENFDSSLPQEDFASGTVLYRALYDYDPREASPNIDSEIELSFLRGDLINIVASVDEDGFFRGEINGQYGLVPSNFVEKVVEAENPRITSSTASNASLTKVKKRGVFSKGKRLLKKLGSDKSKK